MCPSAQPKQRNTTSISSKSLNVVLHPLKEKELIFQPQIQNTLFLTQTTRQEPQSPNPVSKTNGDKRLMRPCNHASRFVHRRRPAIVGAAMDVDSHWQLVTRGIRRPEYVHSQAFFALLGYAAWEQSLSRSRGAIFRGVDGIFGARELLSWSEAQVADWRFGIGDSQEGVDGLGTVGELDSDGLALGEGD